MIYPFECPKCSAYHEEVAHFTEAPTLKPLCLECGTVMRRMFTAPQINIPKRGYYDHGLGKYIHTKEDIKDGIKEVRDGTTWTNPNTGEVVHNEGPRIEEVGTDDNSVMKKSKDYRLPPGALDGVQVEI